MDQTTLVIDRIAEARKLIACLFEERQIAVTAAYWMNALDDDEWTLQLVSPRFDEIGMKGGYLAIIPTLQAHPELQLDADVILPQRTDDPAVREVLDFVARYPATEEAKQRGIFLKGHYVQRAYIYPLDLQDGYS